MVNYGALTMTGCTISGNSAGVSGGGLTIYGTTNLTDCTISNNFAPTHAGGIVTYGGNLDLVACTISAGTTFGST